MRQGQTCPWPLRSSHLSYGLADFFFAFPDNRSLFFSASLLLAQAIRAIWRTTWRTFPPERKSLTSVDLFLPSWWSTPQTLSHTPQSCSYSYSILTVSQYPLIRSWFNKLIQRFTNSLLRLLVCVCHHGANRKRGLDTPVEVLTFTAAVTVSGVHNSSMAFKPFHAQSCSNREHSKLQQSCHSGVKGRSVGTERWHMVFREALLVEFSSLEKPCMLILYISWPVWQNGTLSAVVNWVF